MTPAQPAPFGSRYGASPRERAISAFLSLAVCLLLAFALVRMGAFDAKEPGNGSRLVAIDVSDHESQQARPRATVAHQVTARTATSPVVTPPQPVPSESPLPPLNLIPLSRDQMAAADIGRMPRRGPAAGPPAPSAGDGAGAAGGDGPGGAHLYAAEWVREPTNAEMATYIPAGANSPGAWAMIACRTIDHFHVEDCREMAESPPGSGLARGLRQAAWQFLVRPPRINGVPQVGTWVRIRFDFRRPPGRDDPEPDGPSRD
jgi:protein TonB